MRTAPVEYVSNLTPLPTRRYTIARSARELFEATAFATSPERRYWLLLLECMPTRDEQVSKVQQWAELSERWRANGLIRTRKPVQADA